MRAALATCLLLTGCLYRASPQWKQVWSEELEAHVFPLSVERGLERLAHANQVEPLGDGRYGLESADGICFIALHPRDGGMAFEVEEMSDAGCAERIWRQLDPIGLKAEYPRIEARAKAEAEVASAASHDAAAQAAVVAAEKEAEALRAEEEFQPRWGLTWNAGLNVQTNFQNALAAGVGGRVGLRRWAQAHLGWDVSLGYDLELGLPLSVTHQLSVEPRFDVLWKPVSPGSTKPAASVSIFGAPILMVESRSGAVGFGWRAGVRATHNSKELFPQGIGADWPWSVSLSYEEARFPPAVSRSVRFSLGFGL